MKKILVVFGTRPEAIKMCPLILELKKYNNLKIIVCLTGQHNEMLKPILSCFNIIPDYNLEIMKKNQTLSEITQEILKNINNVFLSVNPDLVLVHGDTTTTFSTALASFYLQIPIGHIEAGLRTYSLKSPFPEEFNRQTVGLLAKYHFAPTNHAKQNLIDQRKDINKVFVTGNTGIDSLKFTISSNYKNPILDWVSTSRLILLTAHRRENIGKPLKQIFKGIRRIVNDFEDVKVIYPVHMNPKVKEIALEELENHNRIKLIEPLNVIDFHNFLSRSYLVLTDSGGIQEEAPSLDKPVLVMRDKTERYEGVKAGTLRLIGTSEDSIYNETNILLTNKDVYNKMKNSINPFGDGLASKRIAEIICSKDFKW